MEVLTVVVSNHIGNINLAISVFRPHASMRGTGFSFPLSRQRRLSDVTVYPDTTGVCREGEETETKK